MFCSFSEGKKSTIFSAFNCVFNFAIFFETIGLICSDKVRGSSYFAHKRAPAGKEGGIAPARTHTKLTPLYAGETVE